MQIKPCDELVMSVAENLEKPGAARDCANHIMSFATTPIDWLVLNKRRVDADPAFFEKIKKYGGNA